MQEIKLYNIKDFNDLKKCKTMTREEIMKIKDTGKRQEAIANNLELFGR